MGHLNWSGVFQSRRSTSSSHTSHSISLELSKCCLLSCAFQLQTQIRFGWGSEERSQWNVQIVRSISVEFSFHISNESHSTLCQSFLFPPSLCRTCRVPLNEFVELVISPRDFWSWLCQLYTYFFFCVLLQSISSILLTQSRIEEKKSWLVGIQSFSSPPCGVSMMLASGTITFELRIMLLAVAPVSGKVASSSSCLIIFNFQNFLASLCNTYECLEAIQFVLQFISTFLSSLLWKCSQAIARVKQKTQESAEKASFPVEKLKRWNGAAEKVSKCVELNCRQRLRRSRGVGSVGSTLVFKALRSWLWNVALKHQKVVANPPISSAHTIFNVNETHTRVIFFIFISSHMCRAKQQRARQRGKEIIAY